MAEIALRPGEVVRIDADRRVLLIARAGPNWEIRVLRPGLLARFAAWWNARRQQRVLEQLDVRTLKDIGLAELAARREEQLRMELHWRGVMWC